MITQVLKIDAHKPDPAVVAKAAEILRRGGLVAFPTETVYGLGANALDPDAVAKIFAAKGRPATNPIIVHVQDAPAAKALTTAWPDAAERLALRFWPGPLTLVLPKKLTIPDIVTAGGSTVAERVPAHPVALALLQACGLPLAAPSANRSTELSPTRAEHVLRSLNGSIDMLLDAGPASGGLESTVLDLTATPPRLLRPGLVTPEEIEMLIGPITRTIAPKPSREPLRSPGQQERHYAPRTPLVIAADDGHARVRDLLQQGKRVGWLTWTDSPPLEHPNLITMLLAREPITYAAGLYSALHQLDAAGVDVIVVSRPPDGEGWLAIHDRLRRAEHT